MFGLHASIPWLFFMWVEALALQIMYRIFPLRKWEEESVVGKVVVVTGAGSGLGWCVAKNMAQRKAVVVMAVRNLAQGELAKAAIVEETGCAPDNLALAELDLASLSSVRRCAGGLAASYPIIDILINNAGISLNSKKRSYTRDGFEQHMGINHLSHFLLTRLLLPQLRRADSPRIVTVTSSAMFQSNLSVNDFMLDYSWRGFGYVMPYCNSKMGNALFSKELARREGTRGSRVKSYAVCPGFVKGTNLLRNYNGKRLAETFMEAVGMELDKGGDAVLRCAIGKGMDGRSGQLFRFGRRFWSGETLLRDDFARDVWNESERLVGLQAELEQ